MLITTFSYSFFNRVLTVGIKSVELTTICLTLRCCWAAAWNLRSAPPAAATRVRLQRTHLRQPATRTFRGVKLTDGPDFMPSERTPWVCSAIDPRLELL